jgi:FKBP-type peptidyl-prolyl cis-trans isomerase FkpA
MTKSIPTRRATAHRVLWAIVSILSLSTAACSSGGATASSAAAANPQPIAGDVERTTFDPSLRVHLDSMNRHADGLYVQDLVPGTGGVAIRGRTVVVKYTGWTASGKQFDTGEITVTLGSFKTIRPWEEGLLGMRVGGKRRLVVPPSMGYGSKGAGEDIPPNAVLVFDMEMMQVL